MVKQTLSKKQSQNAMARHRQVTRLLQKELLGCEVYYDGVEGIDHNIVFNGRVTLIEVKTCDKIIKKRKPELGRFKFNTAKRYPYKISQHHDLVEKKGWYIFVVSSGNQYSEFFGIASGEIVLPEGKAEHRLSWCTVIKQCRPDWMRCLKLQVYGI